MPWWKRWRYGYTIEKADFEAAKKHAQELLSKATKGDPWRCRCGAEHIPIIVSGRIVGELWEDVDLGSVEIGDYWLSRWGGKAHLVSGGRVVGFVWLV